MNKIVELGFGTHRTVVYLRSKQNEDKAKRTELLDWEKRFMNAADEGDFVLALEIASRFQDKSGDSVDQFGVQRRMKYDDPQTNRVVHRLSNIEPLLREKADQLKGIRQWLLSCGLRELVVSSGAISDSVDLVNVPTVMDWGAVKGEVERLKQRGNFPKAAGLCRRVRGEGQVDEAIEGNPGELSLDEVVRRLNTPPVSPSEAKSSLAKRLLLEAQKAREFFRKQLEDVEVTLNRLNQDALLWQDRYAELSRASRILQTARDSFMPFGRKQRIQNATVAFNQAVTDCRDICPDHPDLEGIDGLREQ
jgi:hypothetical protein